MAARHSRTITNKNDIDFLLNIKEEDITFSFIMDTFGELDGKRRFNPYDIITIPENSYGPEGKRNKNSFVTTVGIWIFNKYFIEKDLFDILHYVNENLTKKGLSKINGILSNALLEGKITIEVLSKYLLKQQKVMPYVSILSPNYTDKMLTCTKVINKKKEELIKKYSKEIEEGDEKIANLMEKELLDYALEYLKDDPSLDIFLSGAAGDIPNNFKNTFVMKGAIKNPDPTAKKKYDIATSNYIDGIKPEEYTLFANSLSAGPYARAVKTQSGGYLEKLFISAYQHITLDPPGSDCGTNLFITVTLTPSNVNMYMYSYIIDRGNLVELTSDNKSKYIGKTVKMRFSSMCKSKTGICNKCAGNLFYRIGITNIGAATPKIPSTLKNISMKSFHDSVVKPHEMNINRAFGVE